MNPKNCSVSENESRHGLQPIFRSAPATNLINPSLRWAFFCWMDCAYSTRWRTPQQSPECVEVKMVTEWNFSGR